MKDKTRDALDRQAMAAAELVAALNCADDDALTHDMIEGETGLMEAIDAALAEIDECDIIEKGCDAKIEELANRSRRAEARASRIRAMVEQAMSLAGLKTAKRPTATLSLRDVAPKPIITDESLIPSRFFEPQPPKLNKKALNAAAKDEAIPGVEMSNGGVSLTIRRA